ncbi:hypothetical protein ACFYTQ_34975 [Nocardia sp. NPDC004068]|uniref:hypothetical protein n=1 Tax=Nocardia sp. NPDC004068 TaxID=3364303 RepID=UPI0036745ED4
MRLALRLTALAEAVTLAIMLINLATVHVAAVGSALGPLHGTAYVAIIVLTVLLSDRGSRARPLSFVPGIGGLLALRVLDRPGTTAQRRRE